MLPNLGQFHLPVPHAILFDWDNTLIDPRGLLKQSLYEFFSHDDTEVSHVYSQIDRYKKSNHIVPMKGAEEVLAAVLERQEFLAMGVVSNKQGVLLREEVQALGWEQYFRTVVGASDAARDKPYPDPVLLALMELGMEPSASVWFVGDSMADMMCACSARLTAIGFGGTSDCLVQGEIKPALHVSSHQELWQIICAN